MWLPIAINKWSLKCTHFLVHFLSVIKVYTFCKKNISDADRTFIKKKLYSKANIRRKSGAYKVSVTKFFVVEKLFVAKQLCKRTFSPVVNSPQPLFGTPQNLLVHRMSPVMCLYSKLSKSTVWKSQIFFRSFSRLYKILAYIKLPYTFK